MRGAKSARRPATVAASVELNLRQASASQVDLQRMIAVAPGVRYCVRCSRRSQRPKALKVTKTASRTPDIAPSAGRLQPPGSRLFCRRDPQRASACSRASAASFASRSAASRACRRRDRPAPGRSRVPSPVHATEAPARRISASRDGPENPACALLRPFPNRRRRRGRHRAAAVRRGPRPKGRRASASGAAAPRGPLQASRHLADAPSRLGGELHHQQPALA